MAADGDLSYGSYQDAIPLFAQYINVSFFRPMIAEIKILS